MIRSVRLRNFRRYEDETFAFTEGLNFIEGENNAGKTSVLYAIEYALFGRVGALTPAALMRPKTRAVGVELVFVGRDGQTYRLQRVHIKPPKSRTKVDGHFTLKVQGPDDAAERYLLASDFEDLETDLAIAIQAALGLSKRAWDLAVHVRQGRIHDILEGTPQLDIVLGVTAAVVVEEELRGMALEREKAASALPALVAALERLRIEQAGHEERQAALAAQLEAAEARRAEVAERATALSEARAALAPMQVAVDELAAARSEVEAASAAVERASAALEGAEAGPLAEAVAAADAAVARCTEARTELREQISALRGTSRDLDVQRGERAARVSRLEALDGAATCDHCGQDVDPEHLAAQLPPLRAELEALVAQVAEADAAVRACEENLEAAEQALTAAELSARDATAAQNRHAELVAALAAEQATHAQAVAHSEGVRSRAEVLAAELHLVASDGLAAAVRARQDELTATEARLEADSEHAEAERTRVLDEQAQAAEAHAGAARQVASTEASARKLEHDAAVAAKLRVLSKALKGVQRDLREGATAEMAKRALAIHRHLCGDDKELKGLVIDPKRYVVQVTPADVGARVPAALYQGGGHRLLLGLAVKLALAERIGPCPFVLLDEPTYGLDAQRRRALLDRISSLEVANQLILITHADIGAGAGHRQRVVRDGGRSRVEASP